MAAPVINWDEEICAAVTLVARATRNPNQGPSAAAELKMFCRSMSAAR
jgi:hypothetical protein